MRMSPVVAVLLTSLAAAQAPHQAVEVRSWRISLPDLPRDVAEARRLHADLRPSLDRGLRDLQEAILEAQKDLPAFPDKVSIRKGQEADLAALRALYEAPDFPGLETAFFETWNAWAETLRASGGAARPTKPGGWEAVDPRREPSKPREGPETKELAPGKEAPPPEWTDQDRRRQQTVEDALAKVTQRSTTFANPAVMDGPITTNPKAPGGPPNKWTRGGKVTFIMGSETKAYIHAVMAEQPMTNQVLDRMAPAIRPPWEPLRQNLNAAAQRMADLEARLRAPEAAPTDSLRAYLAHTRLAVMVRFERTLWYGTLFWAQMAAQPLPKVPEELPTPAPPGTP
jgi:hypothetical protein